MALTKCSDHIVFQNNCSRCIKMNDHVIQQNTTRYKMVACEEHVYIEPSCVECTTARDEPVTRNPKATDSKYCAPCGIYHYDYSCPHCREQTTTWCSVHNVTFTVRCVPCFRSLGEPTEPLFPKNQLYPGSYRCKKHEVWHATTCCPLCDGERVKHCSKHNLVFVNHCLGCANPRTHFSGCNCVDCNPAEDPAFTRCFPKHCSVHNVRHTANGCAKCIHQEPNQQGESNTMNIFEAVVLRIPDENDANDKGAVLGTIKPFISTDSGTARDEVLVNFCRANADADPASLKVVVRPFA